MGLFNSKLFSQKLFAGKAYSIGVAVAAVIDNIVIRFRRRGRR